VRPSTVASAIQTQAEFDVRVASSGQIVTATALTSLTECTVSNLYRPAAYRKDNKP
jgi:hypothetical protein